MVDTNVPAPDLSERAELAVEAAYEVENIACLLQVLFKDEPELSAGRGLAIRLEELAGVVMIVGNEDPIEDARDRLEGPEAARRRRAAARSEGRAAE